jgi:hypothetical protein
MKDLSKYFAKGFVDKCAQHGVDPAALSKLAEEGDVPEGEFRPWATIAGTTAGLATDIATGKPYATVTGMAVGALVDYVRYRNRRKKLLTAIGDVSDIPPFESGGEFPTSFRDLVRRNMDVAKADSKVTRSGWDNALLLAEPDPAWLAHKPMRQADRRRRAILAALRSDNPDMNTLSAMIESDILLGKNIRGKVSDRYRSGRAAEKDK